ncbi:uncharacterized protein EDB91DRAFT_1334705 [Suillus paluster]|uniref:uncharacterized protein n=1 Tax=Suillus paluster TaxID=48578 RepID=UPI001B87F27A|nr:uncharacterized protein EDB91DRAFT_1334705 [Suillus paluster]KAG1747766.1 hypothetical protein EDB91DRAFT_1334705 [Suillus paluster]
MVTYSALFSSGLLAPYHTRTTTPVPPSSPMPMPSSPMHPVDRDLSVTPTPGSNSNNAAAVPTANADRPRMRRRRSSINIAANPMALIKSPTRNVGSALQRTGVMSPTRGRAGSIAENASDCNSLFGRLRSGSLNAGAPLRLRRAVKRTVPLAPPPTAPLPALPPPSPSAKYTRTLAPPAIIIPVPRQPLMNYFASGPNTAGLLSPDSVMQFTSNMSPGISSSPAHTCYFGHTIDEEMKEN